MASKAMGTVTSIKVNEGDRVKTNDVLMILDNRDAVQRVKVAEAAYRETLKPVRPQKRTSISLRLPSSVTRGSMRKR